MPKPYLGILSAYVPYYSLLDPHLFSRIASNTQTHKYTPRSRFQEFAPLAFGDRRQVSRAYPQSLYRTLSHTITTFEPTRSGPPINLLAEVGFNRTIRDPGP